MTTPEVKTPKLFYAAVTGGFYDESIHGQAIPPDAFEIEREHHAELMEAQRHGMAIVADADGHPFAVPVQPPTPAEVQAQLTRAVRAMLDSKARSLGYDDIAAAATYADEPAVASFQAEGKALRAWRSRVWEAAGNLMPGFVNLQPPPDPQAFVARMPPFITP